MPRKTICNNCAPLKPKDRPDWCAECSIKRRQYQQSYMVNYDKKAASYDRLNLHEGIQRTTKGRIIVDHNIPPLTPSRLRNMYYQYGLKFDDFKKMIVGQGGKCAICTNKFKTSRAMHIDHCHRTGKIRGILCRHCNHGLGNFKDKQARLFRAAEYLKAANEGGGEDE